MRKKIEQKLSVFTGIVIIIFTLLVIRLGYLQIVKHQEFTTMSEQNRIRIIPQPAPRGLIYDRNMKVLVTNRPEYTVSISYLGLKHQNEVVETLSQILMPYYPEITPDYINNLLKERQQPLYEPIIVARKVPPEIVVKIEENRQELPGVTIDVVPMRDYLYGDMAGHLLGYIREINSQELEAAKQEGKDYRLGDLIGKSGVEKTAEEYLRGKDGAKQVEVDVNNRPAGRELKFISPTPGNNVVLSIDFDLQETLEKSMDEVLINLQKQIPQAKAGAAVVLDVKTGKVLAMASKPGLNPNDFIGPMTQEKADFYYTSKPPAAINRAIQGTYAPGSTFKMITGMAALMSGKIDPKDEIYCSGRYWRPPYIPCWVPSGHGNLNFYEALAVSCNIYFQEAAYRAGIDNINLVAREFGLGQKTGIDLPFEQQGLLPTPEWKKELNALLINKQYEKKFANLENKYRELLNNAVDDKEKTKILKDKEREKRKLESEYKIDYNFTTTWQDFNTFNTGIGQGDNLYTIIQLANYAATIANGGLRYQPQVIDKVISPDGKVIKEFKPKLINKVNIDPKILAEVRQAMRAVTAPGGTANFLFSKFPPEYAVAAKTGTAQGGLRSNDGKELYNGLFVAFAPYDDPQIAFAGVIENGYHGSESIGRVAKVVFEKYFGITKPSEVLPNPTPAAE